MNADKMRILDGMRYYKKTKTENNMVRFIITMDEPVEKNALQYAAEKAFARFRTHSFTVVHDDQRFYLSRNTAKPVVHHHRDSERHMVCTKENNGHMTWIGYDSEKIYVEFFHGVTDAHGTFPFLNSLLYYYCRGKYGITAADPSGLILAETPEDPLEYADSMTFLKDMQALQSASMPKDMKNAQTGSVPRVAFRFPEKQMTSKISSKCWQLQVNGAELERFMRENGTSRASIFTQFMNRAIADCHDLEGRAIAAALAVDARRFYGAAKTMQCCVGTIPVWLDDELLTLSEPELLQRTREMILEGTRPESILASAHGMKRLNEMMEEKLPTLEEKKAFCMKKNAEGGSRYTYGISIVGEIAFDGNVAGHVTGASIGICANTLPLIVMVLKYNGTYHINYCSHFEEDPYLDRFQQQFLDAGIPCTCQQLPDFIETLCDF